jgi:hypothetical protein
VLASDIWNNLTDNDQTVTYAISPISDQECLGDTVDVVLTVKPEPLYTGDLDVMVCSDEAINVTLPSADDTGLVIDSFSVTADNGGATTGETTLTSLIFNDSYNNVSGENDTITYTVTPYTNGCAGTDFEIEVVVKPEPLVTADFDAIVCSDEEIGVTLPEFDNAASPLGIDSFTIAANTNGLSGTATTGAGITSVSAIANDVFTNTSNTSDSVEYTITPYTMGCAGTDFTITVVVYPEPVLANNLDATVCSDEMSGIVLAVAPGSVTADSFIIAEINYNSSNLTAGGSNASTGGTTNASILANDTWTNVTNSDQDVTYRVVPVSGNDCLGDTVDVVLTVNPEPVMSPALDDTVCSESSIGVTLAVTGSSVAADSFDIVSISFNPDSLTAGGSNASTGRTIDSGVISGDTYTNTTMNPQDVVYEVAAMSADGCIGDTISITVTIDPEAVVEAGSSAPLCSNGTVDLMDVGASITGGASDGTWSTSGDGSWGNGTIFSTATTYVPGTNDIVAGTVTLTLLSDDPTGECGTSSDTLVITINNVECGTFPWDGN